MEKICRDICASCTKHNPHARNTYLLAVCCCQTAQLLGTGKIDAGLTVIIFCLAYFVSFLVGMFVPLVPWALAFANRCHTKPDTLPFGLLVNLVINTGYVVANCLVLTYFNVCFLGGAPFVAYIFAMISNFVPIWCVGYIVSFLWNVPAEKITKAICKE